MNIRLRRPRFDDLSSRWLAELEGEGKSAHTLKAYASDLRLWNQSTLDPHSFLMHQSATGAKPATVNRRRAVLKAYHGWLLEQGLIDKNPLERVRAVKDPRPLLKTLSVEQVARLIDAAGSIGLEREDRDTEGFGHWPAAMYQARLQAMIAVQVTAGLRVSELLRIRWRDLDLDKRTAVVTRKGGDEQLVKFGMAAKRKLEVWAEMQQWGLHQYVFTGDRGNPVTRQVYSHQLKRACWIAGLEPISPHALRHTFATLAVESGIPLADLQQMLGHNSVVTTQLYVQRHPNRASDRFDEMHPLAD